MRRMANKQSGNRGNPMDALSSLVPQFKEVLEAGQVMTDLGEKLGPLLDEIKATQEAFKEITETQEAQTYEIEKQRWVSLRMIKRAMTTDAFGDLFFDQVAEHEDRCRREYDALFILTYLISITKQETRGQ